MASSAFSEIAEEFLICRVCLGDYKQPKILPCLHTFCQPCLQKLVATGPGRKLPCPICRAEVPLPQNGVCGLKSNFHVGKLHDILQRKRGERQASGSQEDGMRCMACDRGNSAEFYCIECPDYLCQRCNDTHGGLIATRSHRVITIQDLKSGRFAAELRARETSMCEDHNELIKFYCDSCHLCICLHCLVTAHKDHQYVEIGQAAERERVKIKEKLATVKKTAELHESWLKVLQSVKEDWSSQVQHAEEQIERQAKDIVEAVQKLKEDRIRQLHAMNATREREMGISMEAVEMDLALARSCIQITDHVLEHGRPTVVMARSGELTEQLEQASNRKITEKAELTKDFTNLNYNPSAYKARQEVDKLMGEVKEVSTPMSPSVNMLLRHHVAIGNGRMSLKLEPFPNYRSPCSLAVMSNETLVIADSGNSRLVFYDFGGFSRRVVGLKFNPLGVAVLTNDILLVTGDRHKIHMLDKCRKKAGVIQVTGAAAKRATTQGIAVDRLGRIIVTIGYEVFVLSPSGNTMLKFGEKGQGHQQLSSSLHVTVNNSNHIIISDFKNHKLEIFDAAGQHLVTSGSYGSGPGQLYNPYGVITDSEDNIIVADHFNYRVSLFSRDGTFLRHVLTREEQNWNGHNYAGSPMGLTLTNDGWLIVTDYLFVKYFQ